MFATTYASVEPIIEKLKYDSKQRKKIPVPTIVSLYNKHMGEVDRLDHLIALYRSVICSKKFYHKIFYHLIDITCASAWQEYKQCCNIFGVEKREVKYLFAFKTEVAEAFCKQVKMVLKTKGRPSTSFVKQEFAKKAKKGPVKPIPSAPRRKDQIGHFPQFGKKGRCQDVRELQKSPASNAKSTFALQQKKLLFISFMLNCVTIFHYFLLFTKKITFWWRMLLLINKKWSYKKT